jgi:L-fuculose-phosphate aldolase
MPQPSQTTIDDLLTALRILEANEIIDFNGHASVRHGAGCLINSGASVRSALTPNDIGAVEAGGRPAGNGPEPPMEVHLHIQIYRARPDVHAIVHGHPLWSTMLSSTGTAYRPVYPQGTLPGDPPVFPSALSVNTPQMGAAVAATLGERPAALLKSHGVVAVGADIRNATILALYLEENARRQCLGAPLGGAEPLSDEDARACRINLDKPNLFAKAWDYYAAKIARRQSGSSA